MKKAFVALVAFLGIAAFFLWEEHEAHILGALPYALLLLCIAMHFFMHGGHGGHHDGDRGRRIRDARGGKGGAE